MGVGKHSVAERSIQVVVNFDRAMMLYQALLWIYNFNTRLWKHAITYAVYLWNDLPTGDHDLSPIEIYAGAKLDTVCLTYYLTILCHIVPRHTILYQEVSRQLSL